MCLFNDLSPAEQGRSMGRMWPTGRSLPSLGCQQSCDNPTEATVKIDGRGLPSSLHPHLHLVGVKAAQQIITVMTTRRPTSITH